MMIETESLQVGLIIEPAPVQRNDVIPFIHATIDAELRAFDAQRIALHESAVTLDTGTAGDTLRADVLTDAGYAARRFEHHNAGL